MGQGIGLARQTGPGKLVWQAHIIERFRKKHWAYWYNIFDDHRSTGSLPMDRRPSPSLYHSCKNNGFQNEQESWNAQKLMKKLTIETVCNGVRRSKLSGPDPNY